MRSLLSLSFGAVVVVTVAVVGNWDVTLIVADSDNDNDLSDL